MAEQTISDHSGEHHPEIPTRRYLLIGLALALLTGVEIAIAESGIIAPPASIILLTVLSVAKLVLVAMYYMHLYGDNPILVAIFLIPVPFVLLIIGALLLEFDAFRAVFGL